MTEVEKNQKLTEWKRTLLDWQLQRENRLVASRLEPKEAGRMLVQGNRDRLMLRKLKEKHGREGKQNRFMRA